MKRMAVALLLAWGSGVVAGSGLRAQEMITPRDTPFKEDLRPEAVISSGGRVVGIVGDADPSDRFPELRAAIPAGWAGRDICIGVVSADGLYESRNTFEVPDELDSAIAPVAYPTEKTDALKQIDRMRMGVLVSRGDCGADETLYAVAFWSTAPARMPGEFRVLVNSFRADRVELYTESGRRVVCDRLSGAGQTAFDAECVVPLGGLAGDETEIEIVTTHGTTVDPLPIIRVQVDLGR